MLAPSPPLNPIAARIKRQPERYGVSNSGAVLCSYCILSNMPLIEEHTKSYLSSGLVEADPSWFILSSDINSADPTLSCSFCANTIPITSEDQDANH